MVLLVANKHFFLTCLQACLCCSKIQLNYKFKFIEKHFIVKPEVSWADICKFTALFRVPIF